MLLGVFLKKNKTKENKTKNSAGARQVWLNGLALIYEPEGHSSIPGQSTCLDWGLDPQ